MRIRRKAFLGLFLLSLGTYFLYRLSNHERQISSQNHCVYGKNLSSVSQVKQQNSDLSELYNEASSSKEEFSKIIQKLSKETKSEAAIPDLKSRESALLKGQYRYEGDFSRITDILRGTLVFSDMKEISYYKNHIKESLDYLFICDRFIKPAKSGYRDIQIVFRIPNGHLAELQLHVESIYNAKVKVGDNLYHQNRELEYTAKKEKRSLTKEESEIYDRNNHIIKELYNKAYQLAQR